MKKLYIAMAIAAIAALLGTPLETKAQTVEFFMSKGRDLLERGVYSQAATSFRQALARESDYFEAQYNLGLTYLQWRNFPQSVVELKKALKMQPQNSQVWSSLAIAYDNLNRSNEAMDALARAVNYDPENIAARMNLAAMYTNANRMPQAIAEYREIVKIDGSVYEALVNLSKCLAITGAVAEAKSYLKQAIAAAPDKGEAHSELGDIYWKNENDSGKAITEYQEAIVVEPSNPAYYQQLAWALETRGRKADAVDVWKKALVYVDDPMKKEEIQGRIDRLGKGAQVTGGTVSESTSAEPGISADHTRDLERELRSDESRGDTRRLETKPVDVSGDLQQLKADTTSWDLTKEYKKRYKEKKEIENR